MRGTVKASATILAALFMAGIASAAFNETIGAGQRSDKAFSDADGERIVCRRVNPYARSGERVCATLNDWKAYRQYVYNEQTRGENNPWGLTGN